MNELSSAISVERRRGSAPRRIATARRTILAILGVFEMGPVGEAKRVRSFAEFERTFGSWTVDTADTVASARAFFDGGGQEAIIARVVHTSVQGDPTTKASAKASVTLQTQAGAASSGQVTGANAGPYNLEPGDTIVVSIDAGGNQTFTVTATAPSRDSGNGTFALSNGQTLQVAIDGGSTFTKTFVTGEFVSIGAATANEVVASLNAFFAGNNIAALASVQGSAVRITANRRGSGAGVNVVGGTANGALGFTTGNVAGTGNVSNVDAVVIGEIVTMLSGLTGAVASSSSGALRITSNTTGPSSSVQVIASSTADDELGLDNAVHPGTSGAAVNTVRFDGRYDGTYAHQFRVVVAAATNGDSSRFNLSIERNGVVLKRFFNVSMTDTDPNYVETVVNDEINGSPHLIAVDLDASPVDRPANGTSAVLSGGNDGLSALADTDYVGGKGANGATGLRLFDQTREELADLIIPGRATSAVQNGATTYCEITAGGNLFYFADPPANQTAAQMAAYVTTTAGLSGLSECAAIYWPRVKIPNPAPAIYGSDADIVVAPSGFVQACAVRLDSKKVGGAFEQPAGTEDGRLAGVSGLETNEVLDKDARDLLFPLNVNPITRQQTQLGAASGPIYVDGARPLTITGSWPSIGQRRGTIFVVQQLTLGLDFIRHRNIRTKLYEEAKRNANLFLLELTKAGAFASDIPDEAYYLQIDADLNPPSVQAARRVVGVVGLATSVPAEFVTIYLEPDTRALEAELAAAAA